MKSLTSSTKSEDLKRFVYTFHLLFFCKGEQFHLENIAIFVHITLLHRAVTSCAIVLNTSLFTDTTVDNKEIFPVVTFLDHFV